MSVPSYPFHSLPLKLSNKGMSFPFPSLKLPNKGREEYSKIILFIYFHSILFPPPKRGLRKRPINIDTMTHMLKLQINALTFSNIIRQRVAKGEWL